MYEIIWLLLCNVITGALTTHRRVSLCVFRVTLYVFGTGPHLAAHHVHCTQGCTTTGSCGIEPRSVVNRCNVMIRLPCSFVFNLMVLTRCGPATPYWTIHTQICFEQKIKLYLIFRRVLNIEIMQAVEIVPRGGSLCKLWFRQWLVVCSASSHYLNQCWLIVIRRNKFQGNLVEIQLFLLMKLRVKISFGIWRPFWPQTPLLPGIALLVAYH